MGPRQHQSRIGFVPVFLLHVLATAQTDQIIGSQVRSGLAAGGSRIRTLGPRSRRGSIKGPRSPPNFGRFATDSPLEQAGFELSVPRPR